MITVIQIERAGRKRGKIAQKLVSMRATINKYERNCLKAEYIRRKVDLQYENSTKKMSSNALLSDSLDADSRRNCQ